MEFYLLNIKSITRETPDTKTIEFDVPEPLGKALLNYRPGQYITIRLPKGDQEVRRSYSMSSSPLDKRLAVTVKKVEGGFASTYLHDELKEGDRLEISGPDGRFIADLSPERRRTFYLFAAGSGITPLMSILRTVLEAEQMSSVFLLYGSRNEDNIIFRDELEQLSTRYSGQLHVEHVLSQPKKTSSGSSAFFGLFKKSVMNWQGRTGRIDGRTVMEFLDENMARGPEHDCLYYVCGPGTMADSVKAALLDRGITEKQIYTEHFVNANQAPGENLPGGPAGSGARLIVQLRGQKFETTVPPGATILDVLVKERYDPPYSCTAGACSTCMAKVLNGKVKMEVCYALDDSEVKSGYCLTCQARPETDVVEISYDH